MTRIVSLVSYTLHAVVAIGAVLPAVQPSIALLIVAVILDLAKASDAKGTWQESHYRFRIRSVLLCGLLYVATIPLWFFFVVPGWVAWGLISIWFAYRIVKGFLRLLAGEPID